jgi:hypothetical protein
VLRVQNKQELVYQDHDWPTKTNEKWWYGQVPFSEPKEQKDLPCDSKEFKAASGLDQCDLGFKNVAI